MRFSEIEFYNKITTRNKMKMINEIVDSSIMRSNFTKNTMFNNFYRL